MSCTCQQFRCPSLLHSAPHHKLFTTTFRGQMCYDISHFTSVSVSVHLLTATSSIQCWVEIQQLARIGKSRLVHYYASTPLEPPIESLTCLVFGSDPATRSHLIDVHCILCPVAPLEHPMGPSNFGIFGFRHIPAPQTFGFV